MVGVKPQTSLTQEQLGVLVNPDSFYVPTVVSSHRLLSLMNLLYYHAKKDVNRKHGR